MVDESECKYVASDGWVATDEMVSYGCSKTGWSGRVIYEIAKVHKCCTAWASCSLNDGKKKNTSHELLAHQHIPTFLLRFTKENLRTLMYEGYRVGLTYTAIDHQ